MIPHQPQHGLPPLPPGFDPASMPRSDRFQRFEYDQSINKTAALKGLACAVISLAIVAAWKYNDNGPDEVINFLARYGMTLLAVLLIYIFCCFGLIEYCGPLPRALFGVAGALAASLLTQHVIMQGPGIFMLSIAWFMGFVIFLGAASSFLELELQEAGLFAIFVIGIRLILKFALFDPMFAK